MSQHPSSGVLKTVTASSGTGHNIGTATSLQRDQIWPRWSVYESGYECMIVYERHAMYV